MRALGIDPGLSGALALVDAVPGRAPVFVDAIDVPAIGDKAKRRVDVQAIARWLDGHAPVDVAYIERAQLMPDQNVSAGTVYMRAVGHLEAVAMLAGLPLEVIETVTWKKAIGVRPVPVDGEKKEKRKQRAKALSRQKCVMLFPKSSERFALVKDHNLAEAALIALYGLKLKGMA